MRPLLFQWHPDALAFAGGCAVARGNGAHPRAIIPTLPITTALEMLSGALGNNTPFCVTDQSVPDINALTKSQFATLTGGTSGSPKVCTRSQTSWTRSFDANATQFNYTHKDSIAVLGGLGHSLALYGLLEGLHLGLNVHVLGTLPPSEQVKLLRQHGCNILYATPTQLRLLTARVPLPNVRLILCGGGALGQDTRNHIQTIFPNAALHVFYGAAETSFVTLSDDATPKGSVGRAYSDAKIEIREPDAQGVGTVWVNSPYLFDGYLQGDSPHTKRDGDWLSVGERGYLDDNGYLFLRGRAGRSVNIADQTVHLDELEIHLSQISGIPVCVLLVRADRLREHHLIAVIEGKENPLLRETITAHCKKHGLQIPREVLFLDPLPQLPSGKPDLQGIANMTGAVT